MELGPFSVASRNCHLEVSKSLIRGDSYISLVAPMTGNKYYSMSGSLSVCAPIVVWKLIGVNVEITEVVRMSRLKCTNDIWDAVAVSHIASKQVYESQKLKKFFEYLKEARRF
jgi:hypothetical protein